MTNLSPETVLQRAPDLRVSVDSSGNTRIFAGGVAVECGSYGLAVLDAFTLPKPFAAALEQMKTRLAGAQDWRDLTSTIVHLYDSGVLRDEMQSESTLKADSLGFDAAPVHIEMLNDVKRTSSYLKAIRETVQPGDVVVDVGTGTGVLAVAAARAGARRVYAIEASGIGDSAQAIFRANGLEERITLLRGWSTQVSLPERADVMVSEIIGNEPFGEHVLEVTSDALKRFVKEDARFLPQRLKVYCMLVTVPQSELVKRTFTPETTAAWRSRYDINFEPLADVARRSAINFYIRPQRTRDWEFLSEPSLLAEVDLSSLRQSLIKTSVCVTVRSEGELNGVLLFFELELNPTTTLSTHPTEADENCSWRSPVWILANPSKVRAGDRFNVNYKYAMFEAENALSLEPA